MQPTELIYLRHVSPTNPTAPVQYGPFRKVAVWKNARGGGDDAFFLGCNGEPGGKSNLRVGEGGRLNPKGHQGKWAQWTCTSAPPAAPTATASLPMPVPAGGNAGHRSLVRIMSVGNQHKGWCLGVGDAPGESLIGTCTADSPHSLFEAVYVAEADQQAATPRGWQAALSFSQPPLDFDESVVLSDEQRAHFHEHGLSCVVGAVFRLDYCMSVLLSPR
jgi:hypothetical protein